VAAQRKKDAEDKAARKLLNAAARAAKKSLTEISEAPSITTLYSPVLEAMGNPNLFVKAPTPPGRTAPDISVLAAAFPNVKLDKSRAQLDKQVHQEDEDMEADGQGEKREIMEASVDGEAATEYDSDDEAEEQGKTVLEIQVDGEEGGALQEDEEDEEGGSDVVNPEQDEQYEAMENEADSPEHEEKIRKGREALVEKKRELIRTGAPVPALLHPYVSPFQQALADAQARGNSYDIGRFGMALRRDEEHAAFLADVALNIPGEMLSDLRESYKKAVFKYDEQPEYRQVFSCDRLKDSELIYRASVDKSRLSLVNPLAITSNNPCLIIGAAPAADGELLPLLVVHLAYCFSSEGQVRSMFKSSVKIWALCRNKLTRAD
jgi:hypothetical protein